MSSQASAYLFSGLKVLDFASFIAGPAAATVLSDFGAEVVKVAGDLPFVPGHQDGFDVGEVLVQGRPADPGLPRDLRHGHGAQAVLGDQRGRGVEDGVADLAAVRVDRLAPQLRHGPRIRGAMYIDTLT